MGRRSCTPGYWDLCDVWDCWDSDNYYIPRYGWLWVELGYDICRVVEFIYSDITQKIIGAAMRVHSALGNGFQEVIYQRALEIECKQGGFNYEREFDMPIYYLGKHIGTRRVDFLIERKINVKLKAIIKLEEVHFAHAMNYLEAYNLEVGLLIKFGSKRLEFHRFLNKKFKAITNV